VGGVSRRPERALEIAEVGKDSDAQFNRNVAN